MEGQAKEAGDHILEVAAPMREGKHSVLGAVETHSAAEDSLPEVLNYMRAGTGRLKVEDRSDIQG